MFYFKNKNFLFEQYRFNHLKEIQKKKKEIDIEEKKIKPPESEEFDIEK